MIRLIPILLAVCATALAFTGCKYGGAGMAGSPLWNASATPSEKMRYLTDTYKEIRPTNINRIEAWSFCFKSGGSAGAVAQMQAQSMVNNQPQSYSISGSQIGNTFYATSTPISPGPAVSFAQGLATGIAGAMARGNAIRSCMLSLGYLEQDGSATGAIMSQPSSRIKNASAPSTSNNRPRTSQVTSRSNTAENNLSNEPKKSLCVLALPLHDDGTGWEGESRFSLYVTEAVRRGYTPESCASAIGRAATATQITNSQPATSDQSFKRKMCESSKLSSKHQASFMQNLSQSELVDFLKSGQSCSIF